MPGWTDAGGLFPEEPQAHPTAEPELYASVAINRPVRCEFTYRVPPDLAAALQPGMRVVVPFGRRTEVAVVVGTSDSVDLPPARLKCVTEVLDQEPLVTAELLELTRWMAAYYACSWGEALAAVLPAALKRGRSRKRVLRIRVVEGIGPDQVESLRESQAKQHRLLRTLLELGVPVELSDLCRRLGLSDSPARSLARRGWVAIESVEASSDPLARSPASSGAERERPASLVPHQARAIDRISEQLAARAYATFLLFGVTGSGKTEVYLRAIEEALERGKGAIVLVPEIALTPQTVGWFRSRFGDVAVLHSRMTDAERLDMWNRLRRGEARVVVGARSAVFAPIRDLGVIVVDEEHEPSFKQGNAPRYHARDVAVLRAQKESAVCILGSATPSLESWRNAQDGRYELLELRSRVRGGPMPGVEIVDMRLEKGQDKGPPLFSRRLVQLLHGALERKEQAILFLNRRGFSPVLWCQACKETVRCRQCDVSLTYHRRIRRAICHTCCEEIEPPRACPTCTAPAVRFLGFGSERVEQALARLLPDARVSRMDSDTMLRREDYEDTLSAFGSGEIDVLVGTQMIAKGLDFPRVSVVGIVSADSSLHLPDFRAAERTFQLLSQVAGRAGRGEIEGRIIVQTAAPEHPAIVQAARHDFVAFAKNETALRRELGYPPFGRLIRVVFEDADEPRVRQAASSCAELLQQLLAGDALQVLGPAPAPIALQRGRHRHHLIIKAVGAGDSLARARAVLCRFAAETSRPRVSIDVDPVGML